MIQPEQIVLAQFLSWLLEAFALELSRLLDVTYDRVQDGVAL